MTKNKERNAWKSRKGRKSVLKKGNKRKKLTVITLIIIK